MSLSSFIAKTPVDIVLCANIETGYGNATLNSEDLSPKWEGLNVQSLFDVYCVHKCNRVTLHQMSDYPLSEFIENIDDADDKTFGKLGISKILQKEDLSKRFQRVSLYPSWLINDDIFSIISIIYGITDFVQTLNVRRHSHSILTVRAYILPHSVVSLYDRSVYLLVDIPPLARYLENVGIFRFGSRLFNATKFSADDVGKTTQAMYEMIQIDDSTNIVIVIDRRQSSRTGDQELFVFQCATWNVCDNLLANHLIGFDFEVSSDVVGAYLNYGMRIKTRFYPEYMVSLLPKLFVSPSNMTAYAFLQKLYSSEYKRRWNVNVDDKHFDVIYKAVTGCDHETNNYYRATNTAKLPKGRLLELAERHFVEKQQFSSYIVLKTFLEDNHFDSDAVVNDVLIEDVQSEEQTNIKNMLQNIGRRQRNWNILRDIVFSWEQGRGGNEYICDTAECVRIRRLICNLRAFRDFDNLINGQNLKQFNLRQIIADFDHLIAVHGMFSGDDTEKIQQFIIGRIPCKNLAECAVVNHHRIRRQRSAPQYEQRNSEKSTGISAECAVLTDTLSALHCYFLHQTDELYRSSAEDDPSESRFSSLVIAGEKNDEQSEDEKEEEPLSIDFGVSVLQWLPFGVEADFHSMRDQMVHNVDSKVTQETYDRMEIECVAKIKTKQFDDYTLDEMVGLKFYSDWTKLCALLRKAHWRSASLTMKKRYYYWARTMYRAALRHAVPIPVQRGSLIVPVLYHGLTVLFRMDQESPLYFGPFSTTLSKSVANEFTKEQGLRLHIKSEYSDVMKRCFGIDMRSISVFKREQEILLVDQVIPIQSTKSFKTGDEASINHLLFSLKTRSSQIRGPAVFYRRLGIKFKNEWTERLSQHPQLHAKSRYKPAKSRYKRSTIKQRLTHELNMNEHFIPRVVIEAIRTIMVDNNLDISDPSIPCTVEQFKAGDIINSKRNDQWIAATVSRVFADALCVRTAQNGKYSFQWIEDTALSDEIRIRFPQQNSCSQYQFTFQNVHDK